LDAAHFVERHGLIILAGAIAIGLSLATVSANAQVPGWNIIRPTLCYVYAGFSNGQHSNVLYVYTNTFTVTIVDPVSITAVLQWCNSGSAFYGYNAGPPVMSMFYIVPGMK